MQKYIFVLFSFYFPAVALFAQQDKIAPELSAAFNRGETVDLLVVLREQADVRSARNLHTKSEKAHFVYARLEETAARTQSNALKILRESDAASNSLRLVNAIAVQHADRALALRLSALPEVARLAPDPWVKFEGPVDVKHDVPAERDQVEWGVSKISAPDVWLMGYTGQGITVGGADTGYDWLHPAITGKYRGNVGATDHNYNWHDAIHELSPLNNDSLGNPGTNPCGINIQAPCDDNNHGTHTMGTMTGNDNFGNLIGVAPGAKWIGCRNMERGWGKPSGYIECFEWFLAPTDLSGQNADPDKAPHVINNSWYCSDNEGCVDAAVDDMLRLAIINLQASGVVVVISNGNEGPTCSSTVNPPAYFEESFSVGATRSDDWIAKFSSRGPVIADSITFLYMKPNVSAPGQDVRSCTPNGGYDTYSGTSMAGPHVVGLVALMLSARPELAGHVEDIETIIEQTSVFRSDTLECSPNSPGNLRPNHAYGWGRVDALAAVYQALAWQPVSTGAPEQPSASVFPNPVHKTALFNLQNFIGKTRLEIFSSEAQLLVSQTFVPQNHEISEVSMRHLPAGIYVYKITAENGRAAGRLVKE